MACAARGEPAGTRGEGFLKIAGSGTPRGEQAERDRDRGDRGESEEQHSRIDGYAFVAGKLGGDNRGEYSDGPCGEEDAEDSAGEREPERFGEELARQPAPARAERDSNGEFLATRGGTRDQKSSDVRARDEQQKADGCEQRQERRTHVADERVGEGNHGCVTEIDILAVLLSD